MQISVLGTIIDTISRYTGIPPKGQRSRAYFNELSQQLVLCFYRCFLMLDQSILASKYLKKAFKVHKCENARHSPGQRSRAYLMSGDLVSFSLLFAVIKGQLSL